MQLKSIIITLATSLTVVGCSQGGQVSNSNNSNGITIIAPYLIPSYQQTTANAYFVILNQSNTNFNNLSYTISSDATSNHTLKNDNACTSIAAGSSCILQVPVTATMNSFKLTTNTQFSSAPVGIQTVAPEDSLTNEGIHLFYYPTIMHGTPAVIISGLVTAPNLGDVNSILLVNDNDEPISGQRVLSNNLGAGKPNLAQGENFSVWLPVTTNAIKFKVQLAKTNANGNLSNQQTLAMQHQISHQAAGALIYSYPSQINLSAASPNSSITLANLGDHGATNLSNQVSSVLSLSPTSTTTLAPGATTQMNISYRNPKSGASGNYLVTTSYTSGTKHHNQETQITVAPPSSCSWQEVGDASSHFDSALNITSLAAKDDILYVGGEFSDPVQQINIKDGTSWQAVADIGNQVGNSYRVNSLLIVDDNLIAGGNFNQRALKINLSSGNQWQTLGNANDFFEMGSYGITGLSHNNGQIYAIGQSTAHIIGSIALNNPAAQWQSLGSFGPDDYIKSLAIHNNILYIGGDFNAVNFLQSFNLLTGSSWEVIPTDGTSLYGNIANLIAAPSGLIVRSDNYIYQTNYTNPGSDWRTLSNDDSFDNNVNTLSLRNETLYAGGSFSEKIVSLPLTVPQVNWQTVWNAAELTASTIPTVSTMLTAPDGTLYAAGSRLEYKVIRLVCE